MIKQSPKIGVEVCPLILDVVPAMVWVSDDAMNLSYLNKQLLEFTGCKPEEIEHGFNSSVHPNDLTNYLKTYKTSFQKREAFSVEFRLRRYDGEYRWVLGSGKPLHSPDGSFLGYVCTCTDITETKEVKDKLLQTEEKMRQSPRLEAVGRLTGGIAHDFNNIVGIIILHADLLLEQMDEANPQRRHLKEIRSASTRASSLTQQLLAFGRKQVLQPVPLNLNNVVIEMSKMLGRIIGEDIEIKTVLDENLDLIMADPNQMSQVILNLAVKYTVK